MRQESAEIWLRMYEEQIRHGRHHEALRSQSTNMIVAISAALLAFLSSEAATESRGYLLGAFLVVVNLYGLLMSLKHYERSRMHVTVASKYRDAISSVCPLGDSRLNEVREVGKKEHGASFAAIRRVRAYAMWSGLHLILVLVGILMAFVK